MSDHRENYIDATQTSFGLEDGEVQQAISVVLTVKEGRQKIHVATANPAPSSDNITLLEAAIQQLN